MFLFYNLNVILDNKVKDIHFFSDTFGIRSIPLRQTQIRSQFSFMNSLHEIQGVKVQQVLRFRVSNRKDTRQRYPSTAPQQSIRVSAS